MRSCRLEGSWEEYHGQDRASPAPQALHAEVTRLPGARQEAGPEACAREEAQAFLVPAATIAVTLLVSRIGLTAHNDRCLVRHIIDPGEGVAHDRER